MFSPSGVCRKVASWTFLLRAFRHLKGSKHGVNCIEKLISRRIQPQICIVYLRTLALNVMCLLKTYSLCVFLRAVLSRAFFWQNYRNQLRAKRNYSMISYFVGICYRYFATSSVKSTYLKYIKHFLCNFANMTSALYLGYNHEPKN